MTETNSPSPGLSDEARAEGDWVLVPREPIREMWAAAGDAQMKLRAAGNHNHDAITEAIWTAMLSARPSPPASGEEGFEARARELLDVIAAASGKWPKKLERAAEALQQTLSRSAPPAQEPAGRLEQGLGSFPSSSFVDAEGETGAAVSLPTPPPATQAADGVVEADSAILAAAAEYARVFEIIKAPAATPAEREAKKQAHFDLQVARENLGLAALRAAPPPGAQADVGGLVEEARALHLRSTTHQHAKLLDDAVQRDLERTAGSSGGAGEVTVTSGVAKCVLALIDEQEAMIDRLADALAQAGGGS